MRAHTHSLSLTLCLTLSESAEHLNNKRAKVINPFADSNKQTVVAEARFEAGVLNISLKGTIEVAATSKKDPTKKTSVRYQLNVDNVNEKGEGGSWVITKSYADFLRLDSTLRKALGHNEKLLAPLPPKHVKHKDKEAVVAERKRSVESYVVLATMHPMIAMHASFHEFCNSDKSEMEYSFAEEEEVPTPHNRKLD